MNSHKCVVADMRVCSAGHMVGGGIVFVDALLLRLEALRSRA